MSAVNNQFYKDLAAQLHVPYNKNFVRFAQAWQRAEGGTASYNPFNTTQPASGASNYNSVGVKNYTSEVEGVRATAQTLENGHYDAILAALRAGTKKPEHVATLVGQSPWGTSGNLIREVLGEGPAPVPSHRSGKKGTLPATQISNAADSATGIASIGSDDVGTWITSHLVVVVIGLIILVIIVRK